MTQSTENALRQLIENPPVNSALAQAKAFGIDLTSILENLKLTPAERWRRAKLNLEFAIRLRQAGRDAGL